MIPARQLALLFLLALLAHLWILPLGFRGQDFVLLTSADELTQKGLAIQLLYDYLPRSPLAFRVLGLVLWATLSVLLAKTVCRLAGPSLGPNAGRIAGLLFALSCGASDALTSVNGVGPLLTLCLLLVGFELLQAAPSWESGRAKFRLGAAVWIGASFLCHPVSLFLPVFLSGLLFFPFRESETTRMESRPSIGILLGLSLVGVLAQQLFRVAGVAAGATAELAVTHPGTLLDQLLFVFQPLAPWSRADAYQGVSPLLQVAFSPTTILGLVGLVFLGGFFLLRGVRRAILVTFLMALLFAFLAQLGAAGSIFQSPNDVTPTQLEALPSLLVSVGCLGLILSASIRSLQRSKFRLLPQVLTSFLVVLAIDSSVHIARCEDLADTWRRGNLEQIQASASNAIEFGPGGQNTITCILAPAQTLGGIPGFGPLPGLAFAPPFQAFRLEVLSAPTEEQLLNQLNELEQRNPRFARNAVQLLVQRDAPTLKPPGQAEATTMLEQAGSLARSASLPRYELFSPLRLGWQAPPSAGDNPVGTTGEPIALVNLPVDRAQPSPRGDNTLPVPRPVAAWLFKPGLPAHALGAIQITIPPTGLEGTLSIPKVSESGLARRYPIYFPPRTPMGSTVLHTINLDLGLLEKFGEPLRYLSWLSTDPASATPDLKPTLVKWQHAPSILEPGPNFVLDLSPGAAPPQLHITLPATAATPEFCDLELRFLLPAQDDSSEPPVPAGYLAATARGKPQSPGPGELFFTPRTLSATLPSGEPNPNLQVPFQTYLATGLRHSLQKRAATTGPLEMRVHLRGPQGMALGTTPWQSARYTTSSKVPNK